MSRILALVPQLFAALLLAKELALAAELLDATIELAREIDTPTGDRLEAGWKSITRSLREHGAAPSRT